MSPRATAVARSAPHRTAFRSTPETLREVPRRAEADPRGWARIRRRLSPLGVAAALVAVSLIAVVVGNMQLAAGQLRLQQLQSELSAVQSDYSSTLQSVAVLQAPATVATDAGHRHLVPPSEILQIPSVSLLHRLPPPTFSSAPCCSLTPGR